MAVTAALPGGDLAGATRLEIERVRASGVLGRSGRLLELFEFLAARSADEAPPKEIEIALSVFGKANADAVRDDPVARVYVHRLRRRLDDFYLRDGAPNGVRLQIPKGDYRLVGRSTEPAETAPPAGPRRLLARMRRPWTIAAAAVIAVLLVSNVAAWSVAAAARGGESERLRRDPVWAELADSDRPLMIVVGDYYMFAEYQGGFFFNRLVRDFAINSKEDLLEALRDSPEEADVYSDVDVRYLPTSTAFALTRILRVIPQDRDVRVSLASEVTPETMKDYDIVYIGLVSGLGALREPAFSASRFAVGATYDELVDTTTGEHYVSETFDAIDDAMHRDYGFLASFAGPRGNRIMIISGERDAAVMGVAESLTRPMALKELRAQSQEAGSFEALYEIQSQQHVSFESAVVAAAPRDSARIWAAQESPPQFPAE